MEVDNYENRDAEMIINNNIESFNVGDEKSLTNGPDLQEGNPLSTDINDAINRKTMRQEKIEQKKEAKRLADETYNHELHEQRYKRLMHLLDRSQFYSSYIIGKIFDTDNKKNIKLKKEKVKSTNDENVPPTNKLEGAKAKITQDYELRDYLPKGVKNKMKSTKVNLSLSEEDIEEELNTASETEEKTTVPAAENMPKYLNAVLRDYQVEGLKWLKVLYENGLNGILADEMGLGKTVQVIALFCHLIEMQQDGPYLIVAPLSTIPNWIIEFERFAPKIPVILFHGPMSERRSLYKKIRQKHLVSGTYETKPVVLTSFEVPLTEKNFMRTQKWRYIVVDEGHRIKNHECQLVKVLQSLHSMNRLLLTGTPLQNDLAELWSLLNFLLPEIFNDLAVFESWFDVTETQGEARTKKILKQEEEKRVLSTLREILKPFMLRREKADVCLDIPGKKEVIVYTPITELQRDLYRAVLNRDIQTMTKIDDKVIPLQDGKRPKRRCVINKSLNNYYHERSQIINSTPSTSEHSENFYAPDNTEAEKNILSIWRQYTDITDRNRDFLIHVQFGNRTAMYKRIVNHPYLVHCPLNSVGLPKIDEDFVKVSGKLLTLDAMLPKLKEQDHKVLLFSTMTMLLDMIEDYLTLRDYKYRRLDGNTKIDSRKESIEEFNTDPDIFLFLISTRAGGVGINLASADTVIIYDSDWNPQADIQAMARCHRIGQTRPVMVYRFCTKGTVDEAIINRGEGKRMLEKLVISKQARSLSLNNKETLIILKQFLESKECQVVSADNEVFTEAELNKLLDRSDV